MREHHSTGSVVDRREAQEYSSSTLALQASRCTTGMQLATVLAATTTAAAPPPLDGRRLRPCHRFPHEHGREPPLSLGERSLPTRSPCASGSSKASQRS